MGATKRDKTDTNAATVAGFLDALGSSAPTPGGGAASALVGAVAAALAEMMAQLTVGKPKFRAVEEETRDVIARARALRLELHALMDQDARAYAAVAEAYRLPRASEAERAERTTRIQQALAAAACPPLQVMERTCEALELAAEIASIGNPTVASDAGCAAILGEAAVRAAGLNVLANAVLLEDAAEAARTKARVVELEAQAHDLCARALATVHAHMGLAS